MFINVRREPKSQHINLCQRPESEFHKIEVRSIEDRPDTWENKELSSL